MIKRIHKYFKGELSEEQAMQLWERLISSDKGWLLLKLYLLLKNNQKLLDIRQTR